MLERSFHQRRARALLRVLPFDRPILFLCHGNICRSPFAAYWWNRMIEVKPCKLPRAISAGVHSVQGRKTPQRHQKLASAFGVDLSRHRSEVVNALLVEQAGAVIVMDRKNYRFLASSYSSYLSKTTYLGLFEKVPRRDIADPYDLQEKEAALVYSHLAASLEGLADILCQRAKQVAS